MRKLLNTLYITTQGAYLKKDGETVAVKIDGSIRLRVPIHTLSGIVCFGNISLSPFLMGLCAERNVTVSFLTESGKFLARVVGPISGNVLLRRQQYRMADDHEKCTALAANFLFGKIYNSRKVLERAKRDHSDKIKKERVVKESQNLKYTLRNIPRTQNLDTLRGLEGDAANSYFSVFDELITSQKENFYFHSRNRRPPTDNVNCLLSFLYTILLHDVRSALETVGLDPQVGFLHKDRPGRPSLALDMMEEFRPFIADRLALNLINLNQVRPDGFKTSSTGAVFMEDETRKQVLSAYQKRKQDKITHPFLGEKVHVGILYYIQAQLLARTIRGDLDGYPPFLWK